MTTYTASTAIIPNPERGFFQYTETHYNTTGITDDFTGANGAAVDPAKWTTYVSSGSTVDIQSNAMRLATGTLGAYGDRAQATSDAAVSAAARVTLDVTPQIAGEAYFLTVFRAVTNGTSIDQDCYKFEIGSWGGVAISKVVNWTATSLGSAAITGYAVGTTVHVDFEVNGTTLTAYAWTGGGGRPGTPTVQVTDSAITAAGYTGVFAVGGNAASARDWRVDNYALTTGGASGHTALNATTLATSRTTDSRTVVFRYFVLEAFLGSDTITQAYLDLVAADLAAIRTAGCKAVIRFAYSTSGDMTPPYGADPPVARVLTHIAQLAPTLNAAKDVLWAVQSGFIGMWGEQYYTDNFGDLGTLNAQNWIDRELVLDKLLTELDTSIYVLVRYPGMKHHRFGDPATLPQAARVGFHNDAFLADFEDFGTYTTFTSLSAAATRAYLAAETTDTPMGGESAATNGSHSLWPDAAIDLDNFNWQFLNPIYHPDVLASWGANVDIAAKNLGYRLRLVSSTLPGGTITGSTVPITLVVQNDGYAAPVSRVPRAVQVIFKSGATEHVRTLTADARTWTPGQTTVSESVTAPPAGTWSVHVRLPDSILTAPAYSIQFANVGTWDATNGWNTLTETVTTQPTGGVGVSLPSNLSLCGIKGQFGYSRIAGGDPDGLPNFVPVVGLVVTITAPTYLLDATATPNPVVIVPDPLVLTTDANGYLRDVDDNLTAYVIASDDPQLNPTGWNYRVDFSGVGSQFFSTYYFPAPSNGTVDLGVITPAANTLGIGTSAAESAAAAAAASASQAATSASTFSRLNMSPYFVRDAEKYQISRADLVGLSNHRDLVLAAVTAAVADNVHTVTLPPGLIKMGSQLTIPNTASLMIEGAGEDTILQQTVAAYGTAMITATGGSEGTKTALAGDLAAGLTVVTLPTAVASTLAVGDSVGFESSAVVFGIGGTGDSQEGLASEFHTVEGVSGTTVTLDGPLIFTYAVADSATAYKVTLAPSLRLRNFRITSLDPATLNYRTISINKTRNILIEDVTLDNAGGGIYINDCVGGEINNVHINRLQTYSDFRGYGVAIGGRSAELFVNDLRGRAMRHLFSTLADQRGAVQWGGPRNIQVNNGVGFAGEASYAVWDTHPYGYDIVFDNCHAFGGSGGNAHGFQIRSLKTKIINPVVRNMGATGITVLSVANDCDIVGGEAGFNTLQGVKVAAANVRVRGMRVYNNTLAGVSYIGATDLHITGNRITDNQYGVQDTNANDGSTGVVIDGNVIPKSVTQTIGLLSIKKPAVVTRNILRGYGTGLDGSFTPQAGVFKLNNTIDGTVDVVDGTFDTLCTFGTDPVNAAAVTSTWAASTANTAYGVAFKPRRDMAITSVTWMSGSVSSGNYDIGVYTSAGAVIWSKGSTAWPVASTATVETVSLTLLAGVTYWFMFSSDNTSATLRGLAPANAALLRLSDGTYWGKQMASAFPLPSTITSVTPSSGKVPLAMFREA